MDKKDRKALADQLALSIAYVLKKTDEKAAKKINRHIADAAKQLVKRLAKHLPEVKTAADKATKKKSSVKVTVKTVSKKRAAKTNLVRKTRKPKGSSRS
jgi:negative regulator of replication initiation